MRKPNKQQFNRNISGILLAARQNLKLSREKIALDINVATSSIAAWENGYITPNFFNVCRIARLLNLSLDDLAEDCLWSKIS